MKGRLEILGLDSTAMDAELAALEPEYDRRIKSLCDEFDAGGMSTEVFDSRHTQLLIWLAQRKGEIRRAHGDII